MLQFKQLNVIDRLHDMSKNSKMARKHLDAKFEKVQNLKLLSCLVKGWIKAIRNALGMTLKQLAERLDVSHNRVIAMERDEVSGNIKLSTLERVADALGCDFVYAFVPRENLEDVAYKQAEKKARKLLNLAEYNMQLENQGSNSLDNDELKELIEELLNGPQARLWDED